MECNCGLPARKLKVKKQGANFGREFYACNSSKKDCDMFKWASNEPQLQTVARESEQIESVSEVIEKPAQKKVKITINDEHEIYVSKDQVLKLLFH